MAKIINLNEHRRWVVIPAENGTHIMLEQTLFEVAAGRLLLSEVDDFDEWVPVIIKEWLELTGG